MWHKTGNLYVEWSHQPHGRWVLSGLSTTTASHWAFVLGQTKVVLMVPVPTLKELCGHIRRQPNWRTASETDGSCPTRGILVPLTNLFAWLRPRV